MNQAHNIEIEAVELTVNTESAIDYMRAINNQEIPWSLDHVLAKSGRDRMSFIVAQEGTETGMMIVLKTDGTWKAEYTASIKLDGL